MKMYNRNEPLVVAGHLRDGHWLDWPEVEHPPAVGDFVWQWDSLLPGYVRSVLPPRRTLHKVLARGWDNGNLGLYISKEDYTPR